MYQTISKIITEIQNICDATGYKIFRLTSNLIYNTIHGSSLGAKWRIRGPLASAEASLHHVIVNI